MPKNRIREFRKRAGLTGEQLAEKVGISQPYLSKLERQKGTLLTSVAEKIAMELGQPHATAEIMGFDPSRGETVPDFTDELVPFEAPAGHVFAGLASTHRKLYRVETDAVIKAGIRRGMVVIVDESPGARQQVQALKLVKVRFTPDEDFVEPVTLIRQFVPPRLLITNGERHNGPSIDMDEENALIEGVVVAQDLVD